jgi:hypothetical protein
MADVNPKIVEQLQDMLDRAKAGKLTGLAYFETCPGQNTWGIIGLTEYGQLVAAAKLGGMASRESDSDDLGAAGVE